VRLKRIGTTEREAQEGEDPKSLDFTSQGKKAVGGLRFKKIKGKRGISDGSESREKCCQNELREVKKVKGVFYNT